MTHQVLSQGRPYVEPDPAVMHELEWNKRVHLHSKLLRQLGADPERIETLVGQMKADRAGEPACQPDGKKRTCGPARKGRKKALGALGIRAY